MEPSADPALTARWVALATGTLDDLLRHAPEWATSVGDHRFDERLDDLSADGRAAARRALSARRDELDSLAADALAPQDQVDAEILRTGLDAQLLELDVLRSPERDPLVWLPGEALFPLLDRETLPPADRLRSLAARLEQVPDRLLLARRTVTDPSRVHAETAVGQTDGAIALAGDEVSRLLAEEPSLRGLVEPAQQAALAALREHRVALAAQAETAGGEWRLGPERYAAKLHLTLDSAHGADEVVRRAWAHLDEVTAALTEVAGGDVRAALDACGADAPDDASIVGLAERAVVEATDTVRRLGILALPDDPMRIEVMPEFRRGVSVAYCDPPGPLDPDGLPTSFAISPTPAAWSPERVRSFYREYNTAMITNLTVHEAMPGHVVQLALARRFRGSTPVRAVLWSSPFAEGWAVHAEEIMAVAGHGGRAVRLQQLKMQLRMTLNAILDHGAHAGGLTEDEAMALMRDRGFQEEGEAHGKWRRAVLTSTQLSTYFVGYAEVAPLVSARSTYDDLLAYGTLPPRHLAGLLG